MTGMIELIFVACSILHGATCVEHRMAFLANEIPVFACAKYGQAELAKWSLSHPNHSIHKWRCQRAGLQAKA